MLNAPCINHAGEVEKGFRSKMRSIYGGGWAVAWLEEGRGRRRDLRSSLTVLDRGPRAIKEARQAASKEGESAGDEGLPRTERADEEVCASFRKPSRRFRSSPELLGQSHLRAPTRSCREQGGASLELRQLPNMACSPECRDERDKVFSFLGIVKSEMGRALEYDYAMKTSA